MKLKEARIKAGLSQEQLAEKIGCHVVTYNRYENGSRLPDSKILSRIANVCKVKIGWLFGEESDNPVEKMAFDQNHQKFHQALDYILAQGSTPQRREVMGTLMDLERELREINKELD